MSSKSLVVVFLAVILNTAHFFIPATIFNYSYDPVLGLLSFIIFISIIYFTSSIKKDILYLFLMLSSFLAQVLSYFINGRGVPDYINLSFFNSNIPDFLISFTLLTWWYFRVYKQPNSKPAEIEQDA